MIKTFSDIYSIIIIINTTKSVDYSYNMPVHFFKLFSKMSWDVSPQTKREQLFQVKVENISLMDVIYENVLDVSFIMQIFVFNFTKFPGNVSYFI